MKKKKKSSMIKNLKITIFLVFLDGVPLKGYVESLAIFRFRAKNIKKGIVGISSD